jgi:hypothetical protein
VTPPDGPSYMLKWSYGALGFAIGLTFMAIVHATRPEPQTTGGECVTVIFAELDLRRTLEGLGSQEYSQCIHPDGGGSFRQHGWDGHQGRSRLDVARVSRVRHRERHSDPRRSVVGPHNGYTRTMGQLIRGRVST